MPRKKKDEVPADMAGVTNLNQEEADTMDNEDENIENTEDDSTKVVVEPFDESEFDNEPLTTRASSRREQTPRPLTSVLTIAVGAEVVSQRDKENAIWHEIKNSQVSGSHLTGKLGRMEELESGAIITIVDYREQRIVIPLSEMMLGLDRPAGQSEDEYTERAVRVLNRMMGAEIDFVVKGISQTGGIRAAVASRRAAMLRLRRRFYLANSANGVPQVHPGRIVEARIVAVSRISIRVEIFGVETPIRNTDLCWGYMGDCRDDFFVGDTIQVRIDKVRGDSPEDLRVVADVKSLTGNNHRDKLKALKPQTTCVGRVIDNSTGVIFISLVGGIRAIAHKCFDHRKPGKGDDVLFVCTRIDEDSGVAIGVISRVVRRNL